MKPEIEILTTKDQLLSLGHIPLTKQEIVALIANTTVTGDYEYNGHRVYKSFIDVNGEIESKNDWSSHVLGRYTIDEKEHFHVEWDGYWDTWTGVVFEIEGHLKFYDTQTGKWRTTFNTIVQGKQDLEVK
jgi:hypothetical protein